MRKLIDNRITVLLTALLLVVGITACDDNREDPLDYIVGGYNFPKPRKHLIQYYYIPHEDMLEECPIHYLYGYVSEETYLVNKNSPKIAFDFRRSITLHTIPLSDPVNFNPLSEKYGDTNPNRVTIPDSIPNYAFSSNIIGINIIAKDDFDSAHPAGTSLNDLVIFNYKSLYHFLAAGYRMNPTTWSNGWISPIDNNNYREPHRFHTDLAKNEDFPLRLVVPSCYYLCFKSLPTAGDTHKILIELMFENDVKMTLELNTLWF